MVKSLENQGPGDHDLTEAGARRRFLKNCAKFAAGMPPAVTLLLNVTPLSAQDAGSSIEEEMEDEVLAAAGPPGCSLGSDPPLPDPNPQCD